MNLNPMLGLASHKKRRHAISQVIDLVVAFLLFSPGGQVLIEKIDDAPDLEFFVLLKLVQCFNGVLDGVSCDLASFCVVL